MKSLKTYLPSLLLTLLLTFMLLATTALATIRTFASPSTLTGLIGEKDVIPMIKTQLTEHFEDKYNETGIPAEVYTSALTDEYLEKVVSVSINTSFDKLNGGKYDKVSGTENSQLEESIRAFFDDYADSINYVKDEVYEEKLSKTIASAYKTILDYCDVYKTSTINNEGIFDKMDGLYRSADKIFILAIGVCVALAGALLLINRKTISSCLYWLGTSALVSGIIGIIPCVYLNASDYFDSFVIKQPQIFTAFTGIMYKFVDSFMTCQIIVAVVGILMIAAFGVMSGLRKNNT